MNVDNSLEKIPELGIFGIINPQMHKYSRGTFVENLHFIVNKR